MTQKVLILGASGRFGRNVGHAFSAAGWQVTEFVRGSDLIAAAKGMDVIVNGWNPQYNHWASQLPGLTERVIAAARSSGACVILPGNIYVYGKDMPPLIGPGVPHRAENPLGRLRRDMEETYRASGVQVINLRAGDYIDTEASGNWFDMILAKRIASGKLIYPGDPTIPHSWAYLPDMAKAVVALAEMRSELPGYTDLAFEGYTMSGEDMADALSLALGREVRIQRMNWLPLYFAKPFWWVARGALEMRFQWDTPHGLDGSALSKIVTSLDATPPEVALARAVRPLIGDGDVYPQKAVA